MTVAKVKRIKRLLYFCLMVIFIWKYKIHSELVTTIWFVLNSTLLTKLRKLAIANVCKNSNFSVGSGFWARLIELKITGYGWRLTLTTVISLHGL